MGIPRIEPYPMPPAADLPVSRLPWTVDPARAALLVHDMQNHFLARFTPGTEPLTTLVANIAALRAWCHERAVPVLYTGKTGGHTPEQRGLELDLWGPGMGTDPHAAAIVDGLTPHAGDLRIVKWRYNAFVGTDLADRLAGLGRDQLIVTGVYAHIGVQLTAADAFMRDIRPFVVGDAVADFCAREHAGALEWVDSCCGVVVGTRDVLAVAPEPATGRVGR